MEDLGIEAKEAAVREVAKLLPLPDLLASIASIKSDYLARQQVMRHDPPSVLLSSPGRGQLWRNPKYWADRFGKP